MAELEALTGDDAYASDDSGATIKPSVPAHVPLRRPIARRAGALRSLPPRFTPPLPPASAVVSLNDWRDLFVRDWPGSERFFERDSSEFAVTGVAAWHALGTLATVHAVAAPADARQQISQVKGELQEWTEQRQRLFVASRKQALVDLVVRAFENQRSPDEVLAAGAKAGGYIDALLLLHARGAKEPSELRRDVERYVERMVRDAPGGIDSFFRPSPPALQALQRLFDSYEATTGFPLVNAQIARVEASLVALSKAP